MLASLPPSVSVSAPSLQQQSQGVEYSGALTTVEGEGWMGTVIRPVPRFRFVLALGLPDSEQLPASRNSPFLSWDAMLILCRELAGYC